MFIPAWVFVVIWVVILLVVGIAILGQGGGDYDFGTPMTCLLWITVWLFLSLAGGSFAWWMGWLS